MCLKKTFAILFLFIHLFNICGYQLFFVLAENVADRQVVAALDENNYDETALVEIKLPLNIPYTIDHKNYERCNGQVELNGIHYNYVKRSVQNDTLYLYCIPNHQKTALSNTVTEYAKQATDLPSGKKTEQSNAKNYSSGEYNTGTLSYSFCIAAIFHPVLSLRNKNTTLAGFITNPLQPPEII